MSLFRKILVLVDSRDLSAIPNAERSLARVARLAAEHGAEVTLCDVVPPLPADEPGDATARKLHGLRLEFAREYLESLQSVWRGAQPMTVAIMSGTPFVEVTLEVIRGGYDLVVHVTDLAGRGPGLAPNDMHLVRKCPCPIWVMDPGWEGPYEKVAVAVDRDIFPGSADPAALAIRLTRLAVGLARLESADVHVVHAWQPFGAELLDDARTGLEPEALARYVDDQRDNHARWLTSLCVRVTNSFEATDQRAVKLHPHLVEGEPATAVGATVDALQADLLVIGTVGTTTLPGVYIGNTVERILAGVTVPVVAVKPPGFRSPMAAVASHDQNPPAPPMRVAQ